MERMLGPIGIALQSTGAQRSYQGPHRSIPSVAQKLSRALRRECIIFGGGNAHKEGWMSTFATVPELIEGIKSCSLIVAVDNGILALALALEVPVLAVFGPTDEHTIIWQYERYVNMQNVRVLTSVSTDKECLRPCSFQQERGFHVKDKCRTGMADCMKEITPAHIVAAAKELLANISD